MPNLTNTKEQLAITTSPVIASLWKLIAILIEFFHWQILTSLRNTSNDRRTHLDHRSCTLCSLVLQGVVFSLQRWLKTKSQPWRHFKIQSLRSSLWYDRCCPENSVNLWAKAWTGAWRCNFTYLPLIVASYGKCFSSVRSRKAVVTTC